MKNPREILRVAIFSLILKPRLGPKAAARPLPSVVQPAGRKQVDGRFNSSGRRCKRALQPARSSLMFSTQDIKGGGRLHRLVLNVSGGFS